jgi:YD repeat-containing protein
LGRAIEFSYEDLDQVTEERWYDEATLVRTLSFARDDTGWLESASDVAATYTYVPDGMGRVKSETQVISGLMGGDPITYVSEYNDAGFRTQLTAAIDGTADFKNIYTPDFLQRLTSFTQQSNGGNSVAEKRFDFAYNKASQLTAIHRYADLAMTEYVASSHYQYDLAGRLTQLTHSENTEAPTSGWGTNALAGYHFTYDAASRITAINSLIDGLSSYNYDNTNQLTAADHTGQTDEAYQYDLNGNRIGGDYVTGSNNRLLEDGTYRYAYDVEGNRIRRTHLTTGAITQYKYDHRNRLTSVIDIDPALATADDWGDTSGTAPYDDIEGGTWGWGESTGGSGYLDGPWNSDPENPEVQYWYWFGFTCDAIYSTFLLHVLSSVGAIDRAGAWHENQPDPSGAIRVVMK